MLDPNKEYLLKCKELHQAAVADSKRFLRMFNHGGIKKPYLLSLAASALDEAYYWRARYNQIKYKLRGVV